MSDSETSEDTSSKVYENEKLCELAIELLRRIGLFQKGLDVTLDYSVEYIKGMSQEHEGFHMPRHLIDELFEDAQGTYAEFQQELGIIEGYEGYGPQWGWIPPNCLERIWNYLRGTLSDDELWHVDRSLDDHQHRPLCQRRYYEDLMRKPWKNQQK